MATKAYGTFSIELPKILIEIIETINGVGFVEEFDEDGLMFFMEADTEYELGKMAHELEDEIAAQFQHYANINLIELSIEDQGP